MGLTVLSILSVLISTLFFLYSFLPEALFSNLPCSFSTPFCQRHYSQIYPVLSLLLSVLSVCRHWLVGVWCCLVASCLWDYIVVTVVLTVRGSYSSLFRLFSSPPCSFSTPFCQRHYSQIYPVLSFCIGCLVCSSFMRGNSPIAIPRTHKE